MPPQTAPAPQHLVERARAVHQRLLEQYGIPEWRHPLPPLDELVSTILSQNTNDHNRDLAFENLKARYYNWEAVRDADLQEIIAVIRPAGLANQKGAHLQAALRSITAARGELSLNFLRSLPPEAARAWLLELKGVGPKTAAIVLQFSLQMPAFPVDTHIHRVSGRLGLRPPAMTAEQAHDFLGGLFQPSEYTSAHLNLIRLGREVCRARKPDCPACPLNDLCEYNTRRLANPEVSAA